MFEKLVFNERVQLEPTDFGVFMIETKTLFDFKNLAKEYSSFRDLKDMIKNFICISLTHNIQNFRIMLYVLL